ncbi:MAG: hypothetical protein ABL894_06255 [Hyphomicrobium sp.]
MTSGLPAPSGEANAAPALPDLPSLTSLTKGANLPVGSPTDIYTRVARGALTCWFGASGPLKGPYIYHAEADPPSKGGRAEIVVRTRDLTASDPRSLKAYRISIEPGGEGTNVTVENAKIAEPLASRLTADVHRWAADQEGCSEEPVTTGWTAQSGASPATAKKAASKPPVKAATPVKN